MRNVPCSANAMLLMMWMMFGTLLQNLKAAFEKAPPAEANVEDGVVEEEPIDAWVIAEVANGGES